MAEFRRRTRKESAVAVDVLTRSLPRRRQQDVSPLPHGPIPAARPLRARPLPAPVAKRPAAAAGHLERPNVLKLENVEEQLLAAALEQYAKDGEALDRALDDMAALSVEMHRCRRRPLLLRSTTSLNRMEDLLLGAVLRTHPNRERALDQLLNEVVPLDEGDEERARAEFDMQVDNDFDGLG